MDSTLTFDAATRPARPTAWSVADALVLPAAVSAPAALVIAVDESVVQETSALAQVLHGYATTSVMTGALEAPSGAGSVAVAVRTRKNTQGPPSRGTPV